MQDEGEKSTLAGTARPTKLAFPLPYPLSFIHLPFPFFPLASGLQPFSHLTFRACLSRFLALCWCEAVVRLRMGAGGLWNRIHNGHQKRDRY
jgi:hypothetical protein